MTASLSDSYAFCQQLAKQTAGNFYYSFLALRKEQFQAMCVLYAYMRTVDDLGDDPHRSQSERAASLKVWRSELEQLFATELQSGEAYHPCFPALVDIIRRYQIPQRYFFDVISGVESDLEPVEYPSFEALADYCYHVAGVVGLCCIHIWGFHDERALDAGIECGLAFQMTNILRDLSEDIELGRVYLPREDLQRFDYTREDIQSRIYDQRFRSLMHYEVEKTRQLYRSSERLLEYLSPAGQGILKAMYRLYGGILTEIERLEYDVYSSRAGLPKWRKLLIAGEAIVTSRWNAARLL